jgi:lipoate-protein ligase A
LQNLGLQPELATGGHDAPPPAAPGAEAAIGSTAACFDAPSLYELVVRGRKIVGSAQTRKAGAILQHGAILLDLDADRLFTVLRAPEGQRERLIRHLRRRATSVREELGRAVGYEEAREAFTRGFASALGLDLVPGDLTPGEVAAAAELTREKYGHDAWNLRR